MDEEYMLLPRTGKTPRGADFCLRLDNDCMEPWIRRGELVYVDRSESPEEMQPGVFWYELWLLCANPKRESENLSIAPEEKAACLCLGRVLLKKPLPMPLYNG